jgi:FkbH-like protein
MNIKLSSTSFLLPNNKNWEILGKMKNISFSGYGDIVGTLSDKKEGKSSVDVLAIFLPDLIDYLDTNNFNEKSEINKISNIIKLIEKRLKSNKNNIIICLSEFLFYNLVNSSKIHSPTKKIKNFFIETLYNLSKKFNNLYIVDLDETFSEHGYIKCFDKRNYHLCRCRLSTFGIEILAKNLKKILNRINSTNKKVLLLDCDNTLWGGILGEDGIENIQIGQDGLGFAFLGFQKAIKKIKESGILLVLVSKNNKEDVENVLKQHHSMILKHEDITAFKVNWAEKSENIKKLSHDLYLGLDSFVFWDDNPIEREKIKLNLKEVHVITPDPDISRWSTQLLEYEGFSKFITTKEDKLKTKQYKQRDEFIEKKSNFNNELNYLKSIKLKPALVNINKSTLNRAVQLCQKTNQFNLRTQRYDTNDLLKLNKNNICFLINLIDAYGDHGLVGLVCLKEIDKRHIFLDTFLMSCRILGRHLESWVLSEIKKIAKKRKKNYILAEFIPTKRNQIAQNFLKNNNFDKITKKKLENDISDLKKLSSKSSNSDYFIFDTNKNVPNIKIYE